jgi:hypothetical protein
VFPASFKVVPTDPRSDLVTTHPAPVV